MPSGDLGHERRCEPIHVLADRVCCAWLGSHRLFSCLCAWRSGRANLNESRVRKTERGIKKIMTGPPMHLLPPTPYCHNMNWQNGLHRTNNDHTTWILQSTQEIGVGLSPRPSAMAPSGRGVSHSSVLPTKPHTGRFSRQLKPEAPP